MQKKLILFLTVILSFTHQALAGSVIDIGKGDGRVEFHAIGRPSALKIHGKGEGASGSITINGDIISGLIKFQLNSLDTGMKLRNEHMKKKYLETEKFPEAKFEIKAVGLTKPLPTGAFTKKSVPFNGSLTVHGVSKPIMGSVDIERSDSKVSVDAKFRIKVKDFNISTPEFSGITMADDVDVEVFFESPLKTKK